VPLQNALTMIMAGGRGERLYPLTRSIAKPAVTFGGCFKIIDFTLSNCFNSGIRQVYLLTQYSNATMNRHVRLAWEPLFRYELGEFVESLPPQHRSAEDWYHGTADSLYQNIEVLQRHRPEQVLVLSGDHVYKMNYAELLDYHLQVGAELTVAGVEIERSRARDFGVMEVDGDHRLRRFVEKPEDPPAVPDDPGTSLVSMGVYVFATAALVRELVRDARDPHSGHDFGKDIIPSLIERDRRVFVYPFRVQGTKQARYWRDIGTVDSYFDGNLDLLSPRLEMDLYDSRWPIRTYVGPQPPARITDSRIDSHAQGRVALSLIGPGCVVSGGEIERSVLSPGVRVHARACVHGSILMEGVEVGRGTALRRTIICPRVRVPEGVRVGYEPDRDRARFTVTPQGVTVVPEDYIW
jgi:glucose-1-phosphate adenylyltransferase